MKKIMYIFFSWALSATLLVACGKAEEKNGNDKDIPTEDSSREGEALSADGQAEDGPPFTLYVDVLGSTEATLVIENADKAEAVITAYDWDGEEPPRPEDDGINWQINFGEYHVSVEWDKEQDMVFSYFGRQGAELPQEYVFPNTGLKEGRIEISLRVPEGEVDLQTVESYELMFIHQGIVLVFEEFSRADMERQGSSYTQSRIFPREVYAAGFEAGEKDSEYFNPLTEDYMLIESKRTDGADNKKYVLISFDEHGFVKAIQHREAIIVGESSGPGGIVPVYADEEIMRNHVEDYLLRDYSDASQTGYQENSVTYSGHYLYVYESEANVEAENWVEYEKQYLTSAKEKILVETILNMAEYAYATEFTPIYFSVPELTREQKSIPQYCKPEDFFLFPYRTLLLSEDYRIQEYRSGETVTFHIVYFDEHGNGLGWEELTYKGVYAGELEDWMRHPDNPDIVVGSGIGSADRKQYYYTFSSRYGATRYSSYDEAIADNSQAVYYSNPYID